MICRMLLGPYFFKRNVTGINCRKAIKKSYIFYWSNSVIILIMVRFHVNQNSLIFRLALFQLCRGIIVLETIMLAEFKIRRFLLLLSCGNE